VATIQEWRRRLSEVAYRESMSLKEREERVRELAEEAKAELGLPFFGNDYLEILGTRRMVQEPGHRPEGMRPLGDAPVAPGEPAE
jgi:glutathione synthase/RimK-type ligase-like ATP-grasp enzyme